MKLYRFAVVAAVLGSTACAANLSPRDVRDEIVRQTGMAPASELELQLGRLLMAATRSAGPVDGGLALQGLRGLEIGFYALAPQTDLARLDLSGMRPYGWDSAVRWSGPQASALVLVRPKRESRPIGDLVLIASGRQKVLFARLSGSMARTLPEQLRRAVERGGPQAVHQELMELRAEEDTLETDDLELP